MVNVLSLLRMKALMAPTHTNCTVCIENLRRLLNKSIKSNCSHRTERGFGIRKSPAFEPDSLGYYVILDLLPLWRSYFGTKSRRHVHTDYIRRREPKDGVVRCALFSPRRAVSGTSRSASASSLEFFFFTFIYLFLLFFSNCWPRNVYHGAEKVFRLLCVFASVFTAIRSWGDPSSVVDRWRHVGWCCVLTFETNRKWSPSVGNCLWFVSDTTQEEFIKVAFG